MFLRELSKNVIRQNISSFFYCANDHITFFCVNVLEWGSRMKISNSIVIQNNVSIQQQKLSLRTISVFVATDDDDDDEMCDYTEKAYRRSNSQFSFLMG